MDHQIVITGTGAVTPIGIGVDHYWTSLLKGTCGIRDISEFDTSMLKVHRAAMMNDFPARDYLPTRLIMDMEPYMQYAYIAAEEAISQSRLDTQSQRVGIVMASALNGINLAGKTCIRYTSAGKTAEPKFLLKVMGNICASHLAVRYGISGPSLTVSTACSSGGDAVTLGTMLIRMNMADAVIVMAGESAICPTVLQSLSSIGALSKKGESRPFDICRDGFVMGEGGGAVVLESESCARKRTAPMFARVLGCANNVNPEEIVAPDAESAARCIRKALQDAGMNAEEVQYINAHGTATIKGDISEAAAIRKVFSKDSVMVSSIKGATGHMLGVSGLIELISCVKAIDSGILPPNVGMKIQDEKCPLKLVTEDNMQNQVSAAMSLSLGFGGQNSCIIVGTCKES